MRQIQLYINTGFAACKHKEVIDAPEDWDTMTAQEQEEWLDQAAADYLNDRIDYGAYVIES